MNRPLAIPVRGLGESAERTDSHLPKFARGASTPGALPAQGEAGPPPPRAPAAGTVPRARAPRRRRWGPGAWGGPRGLPGSCSCRPEPEAEPESEAAARGAGGASPGATGKHAGDGETGRCLPPLRRTRGRPQSSRGCLLTPGAPSGQAAAWRSAWGTAGLEVTFTGNSAAVGGRGQRGASVSGAGVREWRSNYVAPAVCKRFRSQLQGQLRGRAAGAVAGPGGGGRGALVKD